MERNLLYLEVISFIYHCKRKTLPLSVSHFIAVLKLSTYTYKYTDVTDDSLPCGLKLIKDIVTVLSYIVTSICILLIQKA